jgi:hypothetical protein
MFIHIYTHEGPLDLQIESNEKIIHLKEKLEKLKGYPQGYQKIVHHGDILKDTQIISDLKLKDEYLICLTKMDSKGHRYLKQEDYIREIAEEESKRLDEVKRLGQKDNARKLMIEYKTNPPIPVTEQQTVQTLPKIEDIPIDPSALESLTQMGFSTTRARKALLLNNMIVQHATEWLLKNGNNPNVDRDLTMTEINTIMQNYRSLRGGVEKKEDISEIDECLRNHVCTFVSTGPQFAVQLWYVCMECGLDGSKGCCESCANTCHKGHKLIKQPKAGQFFCDCGAGESKHACQSLDYDKLVQIKKEKKKKAEDEKLKMEQDNLSNLTKSIQSQMKLKTPEQSPQSPTGFVFLSGISRFSNAYYCQLGGYEISGNDFKVHVDARGDNTNGDLQNPLQSRLLEESTGQFLTPVNANWNLADPKYRYKGQLIFDFSKMKKGRNYTFSYGLSGYSKVFILKL